MAINAACSANIGSIAIPSPNGMAVETPQRRRHRNVTLLPIERLSFELGEMMPAD